MPDSPQSVPLHLAYSKAGSPSPSAVPTKPSMTPTSKPTSPIDAMLQSKSHTTPSSTPSADTKPSANPQQFCLRWNNYQSNLTNVFDQLLQNESFVDVTLACDGNSIKAHKMVLSACSPYFQSLFFDNPCQHPIVILRDVKWPELKAAVEFMYKGEINLCQDQIGPLLSVAEMLKIRGLADVNGEHSAAKATSTALPEITPVAKHPRISARPEWELSNLDYTQRPTSPTASMRYQRKRSWPPAHNTGSTGSSGASTQNSNSNNLNSDRSNSPHVDGIDARIGQSTDNTVASASVTPSTTPIDATVSRSNATPSPPPVQSSPSHISHSSNTPTSTPPFTLPTFDASALSTLGIAPHTEELEIKPGIAEMIREEERAKLMENSHAWLGASTSASIAESYQYQLQSMWQKCWSTNHNLIQNFRFRERGPLKSWRPETMADAIYSVLKDGLSLSQAARKYDIPYPTFVLYANRVHNMLGPSIDGGSDLRPKGRGRPQRILLGVWPDEHIKGVVKTVVFRDAKELRDDSGMHLSAAAAAAAAAAAYGRHSPMYPFVDGQMEFPNNLTNHSLNTNLPVGLEAEPLSSLSISRCWPSLTNQPTSSG